MLGVSRGDLAAFARLDVVELALEREAPLLDEAPVDFQLLLAGPARADTRDPATPHDPLEVVPHGAEARIGVLELRELDLELRLVRGGATGEDVEDQFRSVHDLPPDRLLDRRDLLGGEVVVEDHGRGVQRLAERLEFLDLPRAHVRPRHGALQVLREFTNDHRARLLGKGTQLAERVGGVEVVLGQADGGQHRALALHFQ